MRLSTINYILRLYYCNRFGKPIKIKSKIIIKNVAAYLLSTLPEFQMDCATVTVRLRVTLKPSRFSVFKERI